MGPPTTGIRCNEDVASFIVSHVNLDRKRMAKSTSVREETMTVETVSW